MITKVGLQADFGMALQDLVELEYDAIEAYNSAINRVQNAQYRVQLAEFRSNHEKHVQKLSEFLNNASKKVPANKPGLGGLAKNKVMLGNIIGDKAVLLAMLSHEIDTNKAHLRLLEHEEIWPTVVDILRRGVIEQRRHKAWFEMVGAV